MFPTSKNPFPYSTETTLLKRPFPCDHQNPSFSQEEPPFFLHFPSPFLEDHDMPLNQILSQEHHLGPSTHGGETGPGKNTSPTTKIKGAKEDSANNTKKKNLGSTSRRRTGKKDRHSKICTAQGVRDRRMRLSLQIARKFFDLQDILGFDKASNTIEWLMSKSKSAIKELAASKKNMNNGSSSEEGNNSECRMSECEVVSSMEENSNIEVANDKMVIKKKESREKARARARERTKEKMMIKNMITYESNPITPFLDQESNSYSQENSSPHEGLENHFASVGIMEKYLGVPCSAASMFEYHDDQNITNVSLSPGAMDSTGNSFMGFLGNWELAPFSGNPSGSIYLGATSLDFQPVDQEKHFSCKQY